MTCVEALDLEQETSPGVEEVLLDDLRKYSTKQICNVFVLN
jgi:hypothetical protein